MTFRKKLAYFVLIGSSILFIINLIDFDFNNLNKNRYSGILSNILLIFSVIFNIKELNKHKNE